MTLQLYDTLSGTKRPFEPLEPGRVRMYNCGPTVYNFAHIGNFRSFLLADLLRRYLEFKGFEVHQVMNITDVGHLTEDDRDEGEDKIERQARAENVDPYQIARRYELAFLEDLERLGFEKAHCYPRATEHVQEMIAIIEGLIERDYAYTTGPEGSQEVYFDVSSFPAYGELSGNTLEALQAGARVEVREEKRSPYDFALWKHDPKHLMQWDSPWGRGFPGWHVECSAMSMKYLGATLDIHTGGEDNIFPHHESEIAQSEAVNDQPFVRYWVHARHLLVDGRKMEKRSGNFFTIRDLLAKGYSGSTIRYALQAAHYRSQQNFTMEALDAARQAVERLANFEHELREARGGSPNPELEAVLEQAEAQFEAALDDDLNIAEALSAVFELVRQVNTLTLGAGDPARVLATLERLDGVLGILSLVRQETAGTDVARIEALIAQRDEARAARDWARADALRDELHELGIEIKDSPEGTTWRKRVTQGASPE